MPRVARSSAVNHTALVASRARDGIAFWPVLAAGLGGAFAWSTSGSRCAHAESAPMPREKSAPIPTGRKGWVVTPLLDRVAVVTGSSQGIGAGIALELAHAGADVCINYVGDRACAEDVARKIRGIGRRALIFEADVSKRDAICEMFSAAEAELGLVSILVTNAVASKRQSLLETDADEFDKTIKIGVHGVLHCMQEFSRRMVAAGISGGSIVHICSPHARGPFRDAIDYNVAKAGSRHLALSAANELMWEGIRVNLVQPGWTLTEGELRLYSKEVLDASAAKMPFGRLCMPEDIGKAVVWLSSEEASYVTGTVLQVDGGQFIETAPSWHSSGRHQA